MALSRVMTAVVARTLADAVETVSVPQLRILTMLYYGGPVNLTAIANQLGVDRSNASRPADRLAAAGLVRRMEDAADRRSTTLALTAKGRRLVDSIMERRREIFDRLLDRLDSDDRERVAESVTALIAAVKEDPGDPELADAASEPILAWMQ